MTPRVRVIRLHRRPILPWLLAAAAIALAWVLQLWLLVLLGVAGTIALLRFRRWHRCTALPAVVAGTAAARPPGAAPTIAVEEWAATWLAVTSGGRPHWLRQAAQLVARSEEDPWVAHVAITRLEGAETALRQGRILGLSPRRAHITPGWRVGLWGTLAVGLLAVAHAHGIWWLLPTGGALAGAALSLTELEESRIAPRLLATEALTAPSRWDDRDATALQLALLAGGDRRIVRRARRLVESARWDIRHREAALRQLRAAEAMTNDDGLRPFILPDDGLTWWEAP